MYLSCNRYVPLALNLTATLTTDYSYVNYICILTCSLKGKLSCSQELIDS